MPDLFSALSPIVLRVRPDITWKKTDKGTICQRNVPLTEQRLRQHLNGGPACGVCPIKEGEKTTEIAVLDLDSHKGETSWDEMKRTTQTVVEHFEKKGCFPLAFRSTGGKGVHVYFIWDEPQDAKVVRAFLKSSLAEIGFTPGTKGVKEKQIEIFPKQNAVEIGDCGSQFILPFAGQSVLLDYISFDPLTKFESTSPEWKASPSVPFFVEEERQKNKTPEKYFNNDLSLLQSAVDALDPSCDYETWRNVGMAIAYETDLAEEGFDIFDAWSSNSSDKYPGSEAVRSKWETFTKAEPPLLTGQYISNVAHVEGWAEDYKKDFEVLEEKVENKEDLYPTCDSNEYTKRPTPIWLIKGVMPKAELGMLFGESGAGKSFVAIDFAASLSQGIPWNNLKTKKCNVYYICAEGSGAFGKRIAAYQRRYKVETHFTVIPSCPSLLQAKDAQKIIRTIKKTDVIFVDTFAQTTAGGNENSAEDMGKAINNCRAIAAQTGALVILVHHAGKDTDKGARGWSGIKAAVDFEIEVTRDELKRSIKVSKQKDGEDGQSWDFKLEKILLGLDEDNEEISSCTVTILGESKKEIVRKAGRRNERVIVSEELAEGLNPTKIFLAELTEK